MSLALTPEQEELKNLLRDFFTTETTGEYLRRHIAQGSEADPALVEKISALGLWEFYSSRDPAATLADLALIAFESGRALSPEPFYEQILAGPFCWAHLLSQKIPSAIEKMLPAADVISGRAKLLTLRSDQDKVSVRGSKASGELTSPRSLGSASHVLLLLGEKVLLLPLKDNGVQHRSDSALDLTTRLSRVTLHGASVASLPVSALTFKRSLQTLRAQELSGIAARAIEMTVAYACERKQFGVPVGGFQAVQHGLADMQLRAEASRALSWFAAWSATHSADQFGLASSSALAFSTQWVPWVVERAIQFHGGIGFTWEYDLHLYLRRARALALEMSRWVAEPEELLQLAAQG